MTDGPVKKFALIKAWGTILREHGFEPQKMSCAELEAAIASLTK
jgi:hypothetical protein